MVVSQLDETSVAVIVTQSWITVVGGQVIPRIDGDNLPRVVVQFGETIEAVCAQAGIKVVYVVLAEVGAIKRPGAPVATYNLVMVIGGYRQRRRGQRHKDDDGQR